MAPTFDPVRSQLADSDKFGSLRLESEREIVAGELTTVRLVYQAGSPGMQTGGTITIFSECDSDWAAPQMTDATADEYLSIKGPDGVVIFATFPSAHIFLMTIAQGHLSDGDQIAITIGDTIDGGGGTRSQTFYEEHHYFLCQIDKDGTGSGEVLGKAPSVQISGGDVAELDVIAPPDVNSSDEFSVWVKALDRWGNPAQKFNGSVALSAPGIALGSDEVAFDSETSGVIEVAGCRISEPGTLRVRVSCAANDLVGISNPILASESRAASQLFWGDPHSGQVADARKIGDYYRHARDVSHIDFAGYQRNDSAHSTAAYGIQQQEESAFHEPGRFVPLPGYEWSAHLEWGGHHNVYFRRFDQPMKRWDNSATLGEPGETDLHHVRDLHNHYRGTDTVITPHVGGQHADLQFHDPQLEPALEVVSTHGTFEWFLRESIERGYKMGFVGGNDCHTGRPGDDRPGHQTRRYAKGGLTGIYAEQLDLDSILDAIKRRRCYATTGARIRADSRIGSHVMGEEFTTRDIPTIDVEAAGTGPIERIDVYRGLEHIHEATVFPSRSQNRVRVMWKGASKMSSYSGIVWDGSIKVNGARVVGVNTLRFDSPRSTWTRSDDGVISFHSWACGYTSGLELELDDAANASIEINFESSLIIGEKFGMHGEAGPRRMALSKADSGLLHVSFEELGEQKLSVDMGHLDREISVERGPEPGTADTTISVTDPAVQPGINPYWARVTQLDQEVAWLSPIFVDYAG